MAHIIAFPLLTETQPKQARTLDALSAFLRRIGRGKLHTRFPNRVWQRHSALLNAAGYVR